MNPYQELLNLDRPISCTHAPMRRCDRAAQFAPFAALTGFGETVQEAGRLTQPRIELSDSACEALNTALYRLSSRLAERPAVQITYFQPDPRKPGGSYRTIAAHIRRIDPAAQVITLTDGCQIPFDALLTLTE